MKRTADNGLKFSISSFTSSATPALLLKQRLPLKIIQALAEDRDARSIMMYARVLTLNVAVTLTVSFIEEGAEAAEVIRRMPPA